MKRNAGRQTKRVKQPSLMERFKHSDGTLSTALDILEGLNHPLGLSVAIKLRYGDHAGVLDTAVDPMQYNSVGDFADAYQSVKLLSKYPYLEAGIDRRDVALKSFHAAEMACLETNKRFRQVRSGSLENQRPVVQAIISMAARKIDRILGVVDLESISRQFGWGPGANIGVRGLHTSAYNKFSGPLDVTRNCLAMGVACVNSIPSWANAVAKTGEFPSVPVRVLPSAFRMVTGSEIIFVPKNAKTDRVIAVEPSLNSYVQKGIGRYIRRRLREHAGINLDDQGINQSLAQYGSRTGELATIDMSMASDTISKELVRELLSDEWFELLSTARCEQGTVKHTGETVWFQKFSSMGNAYTFELESLIFYALSQACVDQLRDSAPVDTKHSVSVFGDDIIAPTYSVELLLEVLNFCGFTANRSKSYDKGPFRESCGKDFFLGTNVRPLFLKERIDNVEASTRAANAIRRYAHRRNLEIGCDGRLLPSWQRVVARIPEKFRFFIPEGFGDAGLIANFDESSPAHLRDEWDGYKARAILRVPYRTVYKQESYGYTTTLFAARSQPEVVSYEWVNGASRRIVATLYKDNGGQVPGGTYTLRDRTLPKIAQLLVRGGWYNLGPWIL